MDIQFNAEDMRPLVQQCVATALEQIEPVRVQLNGKLLRTEPEAADVLGVTARQLGEWRRNGFVGCTKIAGRIFYSRCDILKIAGMADDDTPRNPR